MPDNRGRIRTMSEKFAVIGLGYVGLPVALAFARKSAGTVGFDIDKRRVADLARGHDWTGETGPEELTSSPIRFSAAPADLKDCTFFIVCVPTPIDGERRPDFRPLVSASRTVGAALSKGSVVVYESTVYPGATEEICGPVLEQVSGLKRGTDFWLGYSPERINRGDRLCQCDQSGHPSCAQHKGRRSRQGHRKHPARPQHRADERAGADLRTA